MITTTTKPFPTMKAQSELLYGSVYETASEFMTKHMLQ